MKLQAVRGELAAAMDAVTDPEVAVVDHYPDQLAVPAVIIGWGTPWLQLRNRCHWDAQLDCLLVATRFDPSGAFDVLEQLVADVMPLLTGDPWRFAFLESPSPTDIGGVTYLAARLSVAVTIDN